MEAELENKTEEDEESNEEIENLDEEETSDE
jgi:hypothetical protein